MFLRQKGRQKGRRMAEMRDEKRARGRRGGLVWLLLFLLLLAPGRVRGAGLTAFSKAAPQVAIKVGKTAVRFTMKKRSDLTGYLIYQSDSPQGGFQKVSSGTALVQRVRGLASYRTYYFRIRGYRKEAGKKTKYTAYTEVFPIQVNLPGKTTLKHFLEVALQLAGTTLYIWGGGWNEEDTGAGIEAVTLGVSPRWKEFFLSQDASYDYNRTRYQIHDGLDCSGFVGWALYNSLQTKNGQRGYVMYAVDFASTLAGWGWGRSIRPWLIQDYHPGDILCNEGHVWICLGACSDGSVVVLHSPPPGVRLAGTPSASGKTESEAVKLARKFMKKHYPVWYARYPQCTAGSSYLSDYVQFRWDTSGGSVCSDPEGFAGMTAAQVLKKLG